VTRVIVVRRERKTDVPRVREIHAAAFLRDPFDLDDLPEVKLLAELRVSDAWIPELSLVAEIDGELVGHVISTRGSVDELPALGLGPIAVSPASQNQGAGTALMHATIGAAEAMAEPLIALLGGVEFYSRFGFVRSTDLGVEAPDPDWGEHFQVLALTAMPEGVTGEFRYAAPFNEIEDD
jgi:putative acetyltransferase